MNRTGCVFTCIQDSVFLEKDKEYFVSDGVYIDEEEEKYYFVSHKVGGMVYTHILEKHELSDYFSEEDLFEAAMKGDWHE